MTERSESQQWPGIFLLTTVSRPVLGPTQPPNQWRLSSQRAKLTTHPHLVPRSRMCSAIPPHPQYAFMVWCSVKKHRDSFTFHLCRHSIGRVQEWCNTDGASITYMDGKVKHELNFSSKILSYKRRNNVIYMHSCLDNVSGLERKVPLKPTNQPFTHWHIWFLCPSQLCSESSTHSNQ
jgi:hypothetical protein